ncbi:unnamed protein product [Psylliodes chrysocephalus]|uniref:O-acyltransferase n=1 Tax=Psylliodes chrysocephalus TaxID=3402493 RepID=A0A9P0G5I6_9CUCU|nr:unnamed protein product [Psylliodes chrysocephala]
MSPNSHSTNTITQNGYKKKTTEEKIHPKSQTLREKQFVIRNSVLTDLFEKVPSVVTIQSVFGATTISLFLSIILKDYLEIGEVTLGIYLIRAAFRKLHIAALLWICYLLVTCSIFYVFQLWAVVRLKLITNRKFIKIWDRSWSAALLVFYILCFRTTSTLVEYFKLPEASSAIILFEQIRLVMKIHAFVRYNAERIVKYKPHTEQELTWAKFNQYVYFLFAPVLLYRDEYPRTKAIRWDFVLARMGEVIGVIVYQCFIYHRFIFPSYKDFGIRKYTWVEVLAPALAENSVPGVLILLAGFYVTLHSVQNLFAELLRFGDRQFYKDWWTSLSLAEYFRTWNIVVQDWLYAHVYWDVYQLTNSKIAGKLTVFLISVVVHEWVMTYIFGFFYPALSYSFLTAVIVSFIKIPKFRFSNLIFWYLITFGSGIINSLCTLEYYARVNQPASDMSSWKHYFLPRWYTCDCIV